MNVLLTFLAGVLLFISLSVCSAPTLPKTNDLSKWYLVNTSTTEQNQGVLV